MDVIKTVLYFLGVLSVLVIVHEWGHFIVAKLCKMRVEDFSLFFGKRLIRLGVRNGTEYNIRSFPLGGFVKIAGMEPDDISNGAPIFKRRKSEPGAGPEKTLRGLREESLAEIDTDNISPRVREIVDNAVSDDALLTESGREDLQALLVSTSINADEHKYIEALLGADMEKSDPDGYNAKPLWQRALVIFAGPFMSLFFGYILFCSMGFTTGLPELASANVIGAISKGKPAEAAGLKAGDRIAEINGQRITDWMSLVKPIQDSPGRPVHIVALRGDVRHDFTITPVAEMGDVEDHGRIVRKFRGLIGIERSFSWKRTDPVTAVKQGSNIIYTQVTMTLRTLFSKNVRDNVGGPIAIAGQIHEDSKAGFRQVLLTSAMLSVSLGIINLFPIPILDGGHLMLLGVEFVRRRKLSSREVATAQMVGLSIIAVLFVCVMFNDILRLIGTHHQ